MSVPISAASSALCSGMPFGPFENDFLTYCFVQLCGYALARSAVLFGSFWLLWCAGFAYRFWELRRMMRVNPLVTRWHLAELVLQGIIILINLVEFFWALTTKRAAFMAWGAVFIGLAWAASLSATYHEYRRGVRHGWPTIAWMVGAFVLQSLKVQAMMYDDIARTGLNFVTAIIQFVIYTILGLASFLYNVDPPQSALSAFSDVVSVTDLNGTNGVHTDDSKQVELEDVDQSKALAVVEAPPLPAEPLPIVHGAYPDSPKSPEENANLWTDITFGWLTPLLELGSKRPLEAPDLPKLSVVDQTTRLTDSLESAWHDQIRTGNNSFFKALVHVFGHRFGLAGLLKLVNDFLIFVGPVLLARLIGFIQNRNEPFWHGLMYAGAMGLSAIIQSLALHAYFFRCFRVGQQMRASIAAIVYRKAFSMSFDSRKKYTVGEMVNHQSVDSSRLDGTMPYLHLIWSGPLQIIVSLVMLYRILGVSVFAGLLILVLLIPINIRITRILAVIQKDMMGFKDARNKIVNEVLQGIRVIKYFAWEKPFEEKVLQARQNEIDALRSSARIKSWTAFLWTASPIMVSVSTFAVFTFLGHELTPEIAFPALALMNILRFPINALPNVISSVVDSQVSIGRLQKYLLSQDLDQNAVQTDPTEPAAIKIEDCDFEWDYYRPVLEGIKISIAKGSLVAVVGEVGCGKSSFLSALLGDMPQLRGRVVVNGRLAYCTQQAWIQNATVRQNICFGKEFDPGLYEEVIDVCELRSDLAILPAGDNTEIGEKGINLSGGQKQRISLARAVYQEADIYLMDDPLSAVDAHVGKNLFENCILRQLAGKTRVLVTHQLQYMAKVDHIIVMNGGRITEQGTYAQLMKDNSEFCKLIKAHVQSEMGDSLSSSSGAIAAPVIEQDLEAEKPAPSQNGEKADSEESGSSGDNTPSGRSSVDGDSSKDKKDKKEKKKQEPPAGKQMREEERSVGSVDLSVYLNYAKAIGGFMITAAILMFFVIDSGTKIVSDWWLSVWSSAAVALPAPHSMYYYLVIYALISLSNSVAILVRSLMSIYGTIRASIKIHADMLHAVMRSPVSWFDQVPLGRILNRFSKDQYAADESLMRTLQMALSTLFAVLSIAVVIGAVTPWILVYVLPLGFLYRYIQQFYLNSSRELQRLSSISRSPIFALFSESLSGLSTIRGYGKQTEFIIMNEQKIDENQKAHFLWTTANRWLGLRLEFVGTSVVFGSALFAVLSRNSLSASLVGLSITYALQLTSQLNWMVRMSTDVENELVAVERCIQYAQLEPEAEQIVEPRPPHSWPSHGSISFNNLSLRYRDGLPLVLRNITCNINGREKIGVVGRTGAGKSSLMNALFRITEAAGGSITIDGIDISKLGLEDLRSRLAIIPQDPTLFAGTIRSNLDPFDVYGDAAIWNALQNVYLKDQVEAMGKGLDSPVSEFGENLSVGSRQLMCLARALLRNPRILVMDEATASIDYKSDEKIQRTIREQFTNATVLTIAHRIATIADSDRVMVLDFGQLVEFDTPENLLRNPQSIFYQLSKKSKGKAQVAASSSH